MPYLDVSGARLRYDVSGEGPLLVFVHGAGANATVFYQQVAHFNRAYRVLCLDMRGFGGSHCDPEQFHPGQFSDDLARVLDAEGDGPAAVVCQSMGAWAGLPLAVREPDRFAALVLSSSPTPAFGPHHAVLQQVSERFSKVAEGKKVTPQDLGFSDQFVRERPDLLTLYQMLARLNQKLDLSKISDPALRLMPEHFVGYRVPTLVTGGLQNRLIGPETHITAAGYIPGAQTYTFAASGHSSYFEEPDLFNQVVQQFISRHGHVRRTAKGGMPC